MGLAAILDFSRNGPNSPYADLLLPYDRVFPEGATEAELLTIYRPRPGLPLSYMTLADGSKTLLWTTFSPKQIDIDVASVAGRTYLAAILGAMHQARVASIHLDAAGYAIKKAGTNCFMVPETFDFIADLTQKVHALGIEVLVDMYSHHLAQIEIAGHVDWVYDFALPLFFCTRFIGRMRPR